MMRYFLTVSLILVLSSCKEEKPKEHLPIEKKTVYYTVRVKPEIVFREKPDLNSKIVSKIPFSEEVSVLDKNGPKISVLGTTGKWYKIRWNSEIGWAFSPFLSPRGQDLPPLVIKDGKAIKELPSLPLPAAPQKDILVLYKLSSDGHDIQSWKYTLNQNKNSAKIISCYYFSGPAPPGLEDQKKEQCKTQQVGYTRRGDTLIIGSEQYKWNGKVKGFLSENQDPDWKTIFNQAFESTKPPDDTDEFWKLDEKGCRFYFGGSYGGENASFLCEDDDPQEFYCKCFE